MILPVPVFPIPITVSTGSFRDEMDRFLIKNNELNDTSSSSSVYLSKRIISKNLLVVP